MSAISEFLSKLPSDELKSTLYNCCASDKWVESMTAQAPFANDEQVFELARKSAETMGEDDWLEAFAGHPPIGNAEALKKKYASTAGLASSEQSQVSQASQETLEELARLNHEYKDKFGFIFIIFATGKSAIEMLQALKLRLGNAREAELKNAAAEQLKITILRLKKLVM